MPLIALLAIRHTIATGFLSGLWRKAALKGLPRIEKTGINHPPKTEGSFAAIRADGKSNACLLGFKTSDAWLFAMNTMLKTSLDWYSSVVQLYYSGYFEMACNQIPDRRGGCYFTKRKKLKCKLSLHKLFGCVN